MKKSLIFKAGELFKLGYNSSQAVCGAIAGHYGLDQKTAFKMASSFGEGTSRMGGTCGAIEALIIMAGFEKDSGFPDDVESREATFKMVRDLIAEFKEKNGSVFCEKLRGRGENGRAECLKLVESAAAVYADYMGWE